MIIYSVTITLINEDTETSWLHWMRNIHLNEVMNTGCFDKFTLSKIDDTIAYRIDYFAATREKLDKYLNENAAALRQDGIDRFGTNFSAQRTISVVL